MVVLSNNDGCVIARSNEAKAMGVPMGAPVFQWRDHFRKNGVIVYSSNYALYGDMSHRVINTLREMAPEMEVYSIDESFLRMPKMSRVDLTAYGRYISETARQWTGIPVSVGIGSTKTLAKVASRVAKKRPKHKGVYNLVDDPHEDAVLEWVAVEDIWGVGSRYAKMLNRFGIRNALQLRDAYDGWVKKRMTTMGLRTVMELRGTSCIPLETAVASKKGIVSSRSFGRPVETLRELKEAMAKYVSTAAKKLREQHSAASIVHVFIMTNRFKENEAQYNNSATTILPIPSFYTPELISYAHDRLEAIYRPGYKYKKAGVFLTEIVPWDMIQLNLLKQDYMHERNKDIMRLVDNINARWGPDTVRYAAEGMRRSWQMRRCLLSPRYTTQWSEIPVVKTS